MKEREGTKGERSEWRIGKEEGWGRGCAPQVRRLTGQGAAGAGWQGRLSGASSAMAGQREKRRGGGVRRREERRRKGGGVARRSYGQGVAGDQAGNARRTQEEGVVKGKEEEKGEEEGQERAAEMKRGGARRWCDLPVCQM